jgi:hypothetical protein
MADADMEIIGKQRYVHFDTELPPVVVVESTAHGWRGLTLDGQILNVESFNDDAIEIPYGDQVAVNRNGQHVGNRKLPDRASPGLIDRYLRCFDIARRAIASGHLQNALVSVETAISFVPTLAAQYNRAMILLELGRWQEGFDEYAGAVEYPGSMFMRPRYADCLEFGLKRWRGEDIKDKRILLIHDHGFGDSIMMLRYIPALKAMGADVVLWVPSELEWLAMQHAPVVREIVGAHYFCPLLMLLQVLGQTPDSLPLCFLQGSYLDVDSNDVAMWRDRLVGWGKRIVGVAWNPGVVHENDYPRAIELDLIRQALPDVHLISVQQSNEFEKRLGGVEYHSFKDFADCAALMACCDEIVTIDTAAVHLAGAIGHPCVKLLLSHWASWRWLAPLYGNIKVCRQDNAGDWASALGKL